MILTSSAASASAKYEKKIHDTSYKSRRIHKKKKKTFFLCVSDVMMVLLLLLFILLRRKTHKIFEHKHLCSIYAVWQSAPYIKIMTKKNWEWSENVCVCDRNNGGDDVIDVTIYSVAGFNFILRKVRLYCVVLCQWQLATSN